MKKLFIIPLFTLLLNGCETMEANEAVENLDEREVADSEAIALREQHRLEMDQDEALGYPQER